MLYPTARNQPLTKPRSCRPRVPNSQQRPELRGGREDTMEKKKKRKEREKRGEEGNPMYILFLFQDSFLNHSRLGAFKKANTASELFVFQQVPDRCAAWSSLGFPAIPGGGAKSSLSPPRMFCAGRIHQHRKCNCGRGGPRRRIWRALADIWPAIRLAGCLPGAWRVEPRWGMAIIPPVLDSSAHPVKYSVCAYL